MRNFETRTQPATDYTVCVEITCTLCGKPAPNPGGHDGGIWNAHYYDVNRVQIQHEIGHSYPGCGDTKSRIYDVCPECFMNKVEPFLQSHGAMAYTTETDW